MKSVFNKNNLDETEVLSELNTAFLKWKSAGNKATDWEALRPSELIDHIVYNHHAYLYEELPALQEFVTKIYRIHGADHPHLKELYRLYNNFKMEMEEHTIKEDGEVFPLIKEYEINPSEELLLHIRKANGNLEEEHDAAGDLLKQMREITNGFQIPEGACGSYQITYARLAEMESNTFQHVHLENNILFKQL